MDLIYALQCFNIFLSANRKQAQLCMMQVARLFFLIINKDINIKYTLFTSHDDLLCEKAPTSLVQVSECGRVEVGVIAMQCWCCLEDQTPHTASPVSDRVLLLSGLVMSNQIRVRVNCSSMNNIRGGQKRKKQKEEEWDR